MTKDINDNTLTDPQVLELLEERAHIHKDRVSTGKVVLSKQTRSRTVNLPITLTEEYLVITYKEDSSPLNHHKPVSDDSLIDIIDNTANTHAQISINGKMQSLALGGFVEILLSRETATVTKSTHVIEDVSLDAKTISKEHIFTTELKKEVLDVKGDEKLIANDVLIDGK